MDQWGTKQSGECTMTIASWQLPTTATSKSLVWNVRCTLDHNSVWSGEYVFVDLGEWSYDEYVRAWGLYIYDPNQCIRHPRNEQISVYTRATLPSDQSPKCHKLRSELILAILCEKRDIALVWDEDYEWYCERLYMIIMLMKQYATPGFRGKTKCKAYVC
jgi:hypothetical protein